MLIDTLRAHGYTFVPVSSLMGKTTGRGDAAARRSRQHLRAIPDSIAFSALAVIGNFIVLVFFLGDVLMSARLILVGVFAIIDRLRRPHRKASPGFNPRVAVLIPAYNEEKVIVRTIRSVLQFRLRQPARHRDRRRVDRSHLRSCARCLCQRDRWRPR